ncbi:MAG: hypothetical protein IJF84_05955 [Thermoguttaceae bacterium]|nr:hypothetical protein [Thermoguttaceae bacterium]
MHDYHATVFQDGTATFMARIVDFYGAPIKQSDVDSITYSVYLLNEGKPESRTVNPFHSNYELNVSDVLFDQLQTNPHWTEDDIGYNFCWTLLGSRRPSPFELAGRHYLVEIKLVAKRIPFLVRYRLFVL